MEEAMDHHRAVLYSLYAVQHGQSQYEHCYFAHGKAVRLGHCDHWNCAVLFLLVLPCCCIKNQVAIPESCPLPCCHQHEQFAYEVSSKVFL